MKIELDLQGDGLSHEEALAELDSVETPTAKTSWLRHVKEKQREFWSKVKRKGPDDCWPWQGSYLHEGYPQFSFCNMPIGAHRFAKMCELQDFELDPRRYTKHTCKNKLCCNPAHITISQRKEDRSPKRAYRKSSSGKAKEQASKSTRITMGKARKAS